MVVERHGTDGVTHLRQLVEEVLSGERHTHTAQEGLVTRPGLQSEVCEQPQVDAPERLEREVHGAGRCGATGDTAALAPLCDDPTAEAVAVRTHLDLELTPRAAVGVGERIARQQIELRQTGCDDHLVLQTLGVDERELHAPAPRDREETLRHRRRIETGGRATRRSVAVTGAAPRRRRRHLGLRPPGAAEVDREAQLIALAAIEVHRPGIDRQQSSSRIPHEAAGEGLLELRGREGHRGDEALQAAAGELAVEVEVDVLERPCAQRDLEYPAAVRP